MAIIVALFILAYALFYSGFSQWSTGGQGLNIFEALGVPASIVTTSLTLGTPTQEAINVQPQTAQFFGQAQSIYGQSANTASNA